MVFLCVLFRANTSLYTVSSPRFLEWATCPRRDLRGAEHDATRGCQHETDQNRNRRLTRSAARSFAAPVRCRRASCCCRSASNRTTSPPCGACCTRVGTALNFYTAAIDNRTGRACIEPKSRGRRRRPPSCRSSACCRPPSSARSACCSTSRPPLRPRVTRITRPRSPFIDSNARCRRERVRFVFITSRARRIVVPVATGLSRKHSQ